MLDVYPFNKHDKWSQHVMGNERKDINGWLGTLSADLSEMRQYYVNIEMGSICMYFHWKYLYELVISE